MTINKLLIIFLLTANSLKAQIILRGSIKDAANAPIPYVNVFSQKNDSSAIIAFGSSDDKGYYSFSMPRHDSFIVKASAIGYATQTIRVERKNRDTVDVHFNLSVKELILKEAIVKGSNKIIQKSDTITFNADKFRDSTERNLEELLAKIPGIDVDKKTGVISVQGQPIKKILIEGDDLTGHNYQLMSKNMSAYVVDKIQVIDRFMENKLLKGLKRSDDKVINITLKDSHRKLLFGSVLASYGNDNRTNNSLNLYGFYKKLKIVSLGNFNTIGQISTADRMSGDDFKEYTEADNQHTLLKSRPISMLDIGRTPAVSLNSQSTRFNQAAMGSTHFVFHPLETVSLKATFTASNDAVKSFVSNEFNYLLRDSAFNLVENNTIIRKPTTLEGHLDAQADITTQSLLRFKSDFRKTINQQTANTIANKTVINNELNSTKLSFSNALDYTYRINDYHAFSANLAVINETPSEYLSVTQNQARSTPSVFLPSDAYYQSVKSPLNYYSANGQWLFAKKTLKFSTYVGYVAKQEDFNTTLEARYQQNLIPLSDSFSNNLTYRQQNAYLGLSIAHEWRGIEWFSDISSGYYHSLASNGINLSGFYSLPVIGFKSKIKKLHNLFGTYSYNYGLPQIADLSKGFVLTDYRNLERGSPLFIPQSSHTGIFNYTYGNFSDEFVANFNVFYTTNDKGYRNNYLINEVFNQSDKVENLFTNQTTMISGAVERYMPHLYVRLKIKPSISLGNYPNTLNGSELRNTNTTNSQLDISLRSAFLKWFNVHLGSTLSQYLVKTKVGTVQSTIENHSYGGFIDIYLRFKDRFSAKIDNEVFYLKQQNTGSQKYYFINASAEFEIIKTKLSAAIFAKNLLNTHEFINSYMTDYATQINKIKLLPRYVLLELNYRF